MAINFSDFSIVQIPGKPGVRPSEFGYVLRWNSIIEIWEAVDNILIQEDDSVLIGDQNNHILISNEGQILLQGNARIRKQSWVPAQAIGLPPANQAVFVEWGCSGAWQFADNLSREVIVNLRIPSETDTSQPISICLGWSSPAISQIAVWEIDFLVTGIDTPTNGSCTTKQRLITSSSNANGLVLGEFTIGIEEYDANDICIHTTIRRQGNNINDTLSANAHLHGVLIKYVADTIGESFV